MDVCFGNDFPQILHLFITAFFSFDMILNFNTAYFYNGFMVVARNKIAKNYIKNNFLFDIITAFIFFIDYLLTDILINLHGFNSFALFKFVFYLRAMTFRSLYHRLIEKFRLSMRVHMSLIELVNLLFVSFLILHLFAAFWFLLAFHHIDEPNYDTWLTVKNLVNEPVSTQYIYALYWSTVTIMTVGYGDFTAQNTEEVCFSIFTVVVGCMVFAYVINSIGTIVAEINRENILFKYDLLVFY